MTWPPAETLITILVTQFLPSLAAVLLLWLTRRVDRKAADAAIRRAAHSDFYVSGYTYWNSFREDGRPRDQGRMQEEFTKFKVAYANCKILGAGGELGEAIDGLLDELRELRVKSESSSQGTSFSTAAMDERIQRQLQDFMEAATHDGRHGLRRFVSNRKCVCRDKR